MGLFCFEIEGKYFVTIISILLFVVAGEMCICILINFSLCSSCFLAGSHSLPISFVLQVTMRYWFGIDLVSYVVIGQKTVFS